jgi:hypothetical protein
LIQFNNSMEPTMIETAVSDPIIIGNKFASY